MGMVLMLGELRTLLGGRLCGRTPSVLHLPHCRHRAALITFFYNSLESSAKSSIRPGKIELPVLRIKLFINSSIDIYYIRIIAIRPK